MEDSNTTTTTAAATAGTQGVPDVALRWVLLHATSSNVELARLSNVNRSWREVVTTVILEQATYKAVASVPMLLLPSMASQLIRMNALAMDQDTPNDKEKETPVSSPDQPPQQRNGVDETFCAAWFAPEGIQLLDLDAEQASSDVDQDDSSEDYQGNKKSISSQAMHRNCRQSSNTKNNSGNNSSHHKNKQNSNSQHNNAASNSNQNKKNKANRSQSPKMMMMQQRRIAVPLEQIPQVHAWSRGHGPAVKLTFEDQGIMVTHEWHGYRHAMQILNPFGYADLFVQYVLKQAQVQDQMRRRSSLSGVRRLKSIDKHTTPNLPVEEAANQDITQTTIAVRGATIARPEGYCLCWEYPAGSSPLAQQMEWSRTTSSSSNNSDSKQNSKNNEDDKNMVQTIKWQERQRKLQQWKEWRRQLQVTVLPQVLVRKPPTSNAVVQFLNADEKHAVRFMTPQFQCGPIGEPVTILIVGIATEDGCFCSGLNHRFEVGHLYPNSPAAELSELSPICMATDSWTCPTPTSTTNATKQPHRTPLEHHLLDDDSEADSDECGEDDEEDAYNDSEDDSSSDFVGGSDNLRTISKKNSWLNQCTCIFQDRSDPCNLSGGNPFQTPTAATVAAAANNDEDAKAETDTDDAVKQESTMEREDSQTMRLEDDDDESDEDGADSEDDDDDDDDDEDHDAERILRGSRIPGMWHCYTAVFDGKQSIMRVDGVQEVLTSSKPKKYKVDNNKSNSNNGADTSNRRQSLGPRAMLDGLTIGSDHCFDMTLCFGQGSGGEGEGAVAEIAVFSGCLDTKDLEVLEQELMTKHGIPIPGLGRQDLEKEDDWTRKSHALYCQMPPEAARSSQGSPLSFELSSIPLRIMTKHRSVAWHQVNSVTGEELRIKRIGSRSAGSSSDW